MGTPPPLKNYSVHVTDLELSDEDERDKSPQEDTSPQNCKRVGADKLGPQDVEEICENDNNDVSENNNSYYPELCLYDIIIEKKNITWRRGKYIKQDTVYSENTERDGDVELLSPLSYFMRYIKD